MLPEGMAAKRDGGTITVRVVPRSQRRGVEVRDGRILVRVRAAPVEGRATEEARRALAKALGVRSSAVRLRSGATTRDKSFEIDGVTIEEALGRLRG
jgi:hypothetical protein